MLGRLEQPEAEGSSRTGASSMELSPRKRGGARRRRTLSVALLLRAVTVSRRLAAVTSFAVP
jgi:hypothetical protein